MEITTLEVERKRGGKRLMMLMLVYILLTCLYLSDALLS